MDTLKLFATYETPLTLAVQAKKLRAQGWDTHGDDNTLNCLQPGLTLQLELSGDHLFLLRGELDQFPNAATDALLAFLRHCAEQFQVDIFEEDGRLVRRVSSND